ncbi:MAG: hypothetical protein LBQ60_12240 [Bacteroidales bacterium]|jgi:hypothetical protein|nr:hypothetical protein [Bacteroidales bacterium]
MMFDISSNSKITLKANTIKYYVDINNLVNSTFISSLLFEATKSNQKWLDDLNALRLSAAFERKIVNIVGFA